MKNSLKSALLVVGLAMANTGFAGSGDLIGGLVGGLLVGGIASAAAANSSNKSSKKVEKKLEQMEFKQEQDAKREQMRREMELQNSFERRMAENNAKNVHQAPQGDSTSNMLYILMGLVAFLMVGVMGLGMAVFRAGR